MDLRPILITIASQYNLNPCGSHGVSHWGRVLENGHRLAEITGADRIVVTLFALFHDACRWNDGADPGHGERGAHLASTDFNATSPDFLTASQLALLMEACAFHTQGLTDGDITVQTCWDADRLDLARVGTIPHPEHLCTAPAKAADFIWWASTRARERYVPQFVEEDWFRWFKPKSWS